MQESKSRHCEGNRREAVVYADRSLVKNMTTKKKVQPKPKIQQYATPALEKGLDVLELLARQPEGLTKSQIARELQRTVSEIFRMLVCLQSRGYIAQARDERFVLTLKLFKLVQEHPPTELLVAKALPVMHRLAHSTLQSCHLGVVEGGQVVFLAQVNAPTNLGFYVKLGSTADLMEAASGYVLLAHQSPEQRVRMVQAWSAETGNKPPKDLELHLASIRKGCYEKRASYLVKGVVNVSFPVFDDRGAAIAALTVPFIQYTGSQVGVADVISALRVAAAEITETIGGARG
ncbi:IclR family transcriptional regulator [Granulicella tundricola]|uniref:Transcriptional regulator, IclR family n=1 Tax=Granulicella tundricola (strain ATCC BAA-1859 / DSM 23138 / MP5ACTX9) TaxID=1198114 RepID=E8X715_GRATM|nr:IclR family transcriptional regulator [Granulicella tundricola]ADW71124.1 transcriptional regulator, IclR family [Granulicella tundricola MP5ACTX9]